SSSGRGLFQLSLATPTFLLLLRLIRRLSFPLRLRKSGCTRTVLVPVGFWIRQGWLALTLASPSLILFIRWLRRSLLSVRSRWVRTLSTSSTVHVKLSTFFSRTLLAAPLRRVSVIPRCATTWTPCLWGSKTRKGSLRRLVWTLIAVRTRWICSAGTRPNHGTARWAVVLPRSVSRFLPILPRI